MRSVRAAIGSSLRSARAEDQQVLVRQHVRLLDQRVTSPLHLFDHLVARELVVHLGSDGQRALLPVDHRDTAARPQRRAQGIEVCDARVDVVVGVHHEDDVDRLLLIKRMKPLGYPLEEMARLLRLIDALEDGSRPLEDAALAPDEARAQLRSYAEAVEERIIDLKTKVEYAQEFRERILVEIERRATHLT